MPQNPQQTTNVNRNPLRRMRTESNFVFTDYNRSNDVIVVPKLDMKSIDTEHSSVNTALQRSGSARRKFVNEPMPVSGVISDGRAPSLSARGRKDDPYSNLRKELR